MDFQLITLREYWGNNLESTRQVKQYADGRLEELPLPDIPDEDFEEETPEEEDDDHEGQNGY